MPGKKLSPKIARALGAVIRELRTAKGLTQEELGFAADVQRKFVSLVELGQTQPSLATLLAIADVLGRSASAILREVEQQACNSKESQHTRRTR